MTTAEKHQLRIARRTLRMNDIFAQVMGGMTKAEAQAVIARQQKRATGRKDHGSRQEGG